MGDSILLFLVLFPIVGAFASYLIGRKNKNLRDYFAAFVCIVDLAIMAMLFVNVAGGKDLFLFPDLQTMTILPWRPQQGRVMRMFCYIRYADGSDFEGDGRCFLKNAMKAAISKGYCFRFSTSCEFTLFKKVVWDFQQKFPMI